MIIYHKEQILSTFLHYISLPNMKNRNLDVVQECQKTDYVLSKEQISRAKKDKNAENTQTDVISYAGEIVETLCNSSLKTDEVRKEQN